MNMCYCREISKTTPDRLTKAHTNGVEPTATPDAPVMTQKRYEAGKQLPILYGILGATATGVIGGAIEGALQANTYRQEHIAKAAGYQQCLDKWVDPIERGVGRIVLTSALSPEDRQACGIRADDPNGDGKGSYVRDPTGHLVDITSAQLDEPAPFPTSLELNRALGAEETLAAQFEPAPYLTAPLRGMQAWAVAMLIKSYTMRDRKNRITLRQRWERAFVKEVHPKTTSSRSPLQ